MTDVNIFNQLIIWPFINLLMVFYKGFELLRIPGNLGLSIIALTITIRTLLNPLTNKQMESAQKMQLLKPHLDELNKRHKNDKKKLQEEQLKLYQQHGINPAAGCLPLLLSFPILIGLYQVFYKVLNTDNISSVVESINKVVYSPLLKIQSLDLSFFGLNLAHKPSSWQEHGWWLLAVPVITGALQYYQMKKTTPQQNSSTSTVKKTNKKTKTEEKKPEDFSADMQKQMILIFPVMIGFAAYSFPIGLALYWCTFSLLSAFSHKQIAALSPVSPAKK